MLLKVDSNVYTTRVPDILEGVAEGNSDTIATKIGKQVERWKSKRELQCVNEFAGGCLSSDVSLSVFDSSMFVVVYPQNKKEYNLVYFQDSILFEYRRYPVFQKASISANGFDNQEKQFYDNSSSSMTTESSSDDARAERNEKRRHWSILENHKYDPLTSNPTATLAKAPAIDGKEMRKLTVKLPHHAVSKASSPTDLAKHMFKKNMLNQNFAEYVYFDSLPVEKNALWNNLENVQYLRSFNMSPMKRFSNEIKDSSGKIISINNESRPYVEWGTFTSRKEPKQILQGADQYSFVADYQSLDAGDSLIRWPNKDEFDGNHILRINSHFMPIETEDVFGRVASAHYSDDGIHQTGLFFPASLNKTASIVLDGDEITEVNLKQSTKNKLEASPSKKGMIVQSSMHLTCSVFDCDSNLVAEYRVKKKGESWFTERINVKDLKLNLSKGDILNYLRIYPKKAQAKTFIYDRYANIVQIVGEDNTSTYYEYDPFGKLIQTRNDDGVGFKSHHREFMNDDRNEIPWNEIVISSSSSDI